MHQRAQRLTGWGEQACHRLGECGTRYCGLARVGHHTLDQPDRSTGEGAATLVGGIDREPGPVDDPPGKSQDIRGGLGRHRPQGPGRLTGEVEETRGHRHATDAVGDGVVQLDDHRGAIAVPALDQRHLPERSISIEVLFGHLLGNAQQRSVGAVLGNVEPLEVEGEVEVGIDLPPWGDRRDRIADDPLAKLRDSQGHPRDPVDEQVDIGRLVQHGHRDHDRPQDRILLDAPHDRVERTHPVKPVVRHRALLATRGPRRRGYRAGRSHARARRPREPSVMVELRGSVGRPQGDLLPSPHSAETTQCEGPPGTTGGPSHCGAEGIRRGRRTAAPPESPQHSGAQCLGARGNIPGPLGIVELRGLEPLTPSMRTRCATSCATAP